MSELQQLLKMKRLETPGPQYFDAFLDEFHRYQRAEILHKPTLADRLRSMWMHVVAQPAWAGVACVAFISAMGLLSQMEKTSSAPQVASVPLYSQEQQERWIGLEFAESVPVSYQQAQWQQPELQRADAVEVKAPLYVTGDAVNVAYDTTLAF